MTAISYAERPVASRTPALFGRVMALLAVTVGFATLGVWSAPVCILAPGEAG